MRPARLAPGDLRRERKGELQVHSQANIRRLVPVQCARCPQFDQPRMLHEKLTLAAGARGMSTSRSKKMAPHGGGARLPLTPPSGVGSLKRRALQGKCHAKAWGFAMPGRAGGRVGPCQSFLPKWVHCRQARCHSLLLARSRGQLGIGSPAAGPFTRALARQVPQRREGLVDVCRCMVGRDLESSPLGTTG